MPISNLSNGLRTGVCTSTNRPTTPYEGQVIYETDTDKVLVWNGTAWYANWNTAWGLVAYISTTGTTTGTATEAVVLTTASFTAIANRYYRITYFEPYYETTTTNIEVTARIRLTNLAGTIQTRGVTFTTGSGQEGQVQASVIKTLTAGATVLVGTIQAQGGSIYAYGDSTYLRQLWVEDIGAV